MTAIRVDGLGKRYRIYASPRERLKDLLRAGWGRCSEFWALKGVSFEINPGEVVGIVGRNGSGKSTLLQMIAGTLTPTTGRVAVNGRVAALLELGSGFDMEFTGRENVFFNGMLLGASREEIAERLAEIEAFAEIGPYFDQPVKTYSSGMVVRLAFAVQTLLDKDILIVDEALAVGDELFQRKCFAAMERFRESGGTVLFVSHAGDTVVQLCDRALLLHRGELVLEGNAKRVMDWYHKLIYAPAEAESRLLARIGESLDQEDQYPPAEVTVMDKAEDAGQELNEVDYDPNLQSRSTLFYEDRGVRIVHYAVRDDDGRIVNLLHPRTCYHWTYEVIFDRPACRVRFGMTIKTAAGLELGGAVSAKPFQGVEVAAGQRLRVSFTFQSLLVPDIYFINGGVVGEQNGEEHYLARGVDLGVFRILAEGERFVSGGVVDFLASSRIEFLDASHPANSRPSHIPDANRVSAGRLGGGRL